MRNDRKAALRVSLLVIIALGLSAVPSQARMHRRPHRDMERDYTQGRFQLYAGIGGQGYEIDDRDYSYLDERSSGGMLFIGAALGLSRSLSVYIEGGGSDHETDLGNVSFGYTHIGLKYAPSNGGSSWQPYGKVSAGGIFLFESDNHHHGWYHDDNNGYAGPSFALGAGVDKFLNRHTALYGEVGMLMGKFDQRIDNGREHDLADEIGVTSARLQFGIRFRL